MTTGDAMDAAVGARHDPALALAPDMKHEGPAANHATEVIPVFQGEAMHDGAAYHGDEYPTDAELNTLQRVSEKIPWAVYTIAFVELVERFSYYGTSVVFTNFIQQPLPAGSKTGAGIHDPNQQSGALGQHQQTSTGIGTFNQFWVYTMPLFGAYIADAHLGRFKTVCIAIAIAIVGHVILVVSSVPSVIVHTSGSLACFIIGVIIMGVGTGMFKPNISPMIAEQLPIDHMKVITNEKGERVIVDPTVTQSRIYHYFYMFINIGSLVGQLSMSYSELYVGFWLAFLLPTIMMCITPVVMIWGRKRYKQAPPQGSVLGKSMRIFLRANKGRWSLNPVSTYKRLHDGTFWENVKPSNIPAAQRPAWMTFDDQWVDEVRRGFAACSVFCWYPLYWITYNQLNNNLISQAATMERHGLPNEVLSNLDPFALIIFIPICDIFVYPALRKVGIRFTPIKKITLGFYTGSAAMIWAAVLQAYIYKYSECGSHASGTLPNGDACPAVAINVWAQTGAYVLIALSEIFASITSLEYAFSKAPRNMRSLVQAVALFTTAIAAAIGEALNPLSTDPLLVWNYGVMAVLSGVGGTCFWFQYRSLDREEDELNNLPVGRLATSKDVEDSESLDGHHAVTEIDEKGRAKNDNVEPQGGNGDTVKL